MAISDEKLSAFLDNELSRKDMDEVRLALARDETLSDRLAMLSQVDDAVNSYAAQIDRTPVPTQLQALLTDSPAAQAEHPASNTVVSISAWQAAKQKLREHVALAAGVALLIGIGAGQMLPSGDTTMGPSYWAQIGEALNATASGHRAILASGDELQPYFSFTAGDGRLCRSYAVYGEFTRDEIACRSGNAWLPVATAYRSNTEAGDYAAASASQLMEVTLQVLDGSAALSIEEEQARLADLD